MAPHIPGAKTSAKVIMKGFKKTIQTGRDIYGNAVESKKIRNSADKLLKLTKERREIQAIKTSVMLEILGETNMKTFGEQMYDFLDTYKKFKDVKWTGEISVDNKLNAEEIVILDKMSIEATVAKELLKGTAGSFAVGTFAGIAAYGGAGAFAAASTGTAISSLHGVAATNAILAWFGGGPVAAGGFGMAGGMVVLGGIVAVPAVVVAVVYLSASMKRVLANTRKYEQDTNEDVEKMNIFIDSLVSIFNLAHDYNEFIVAFNERFKEAIASVKRIYQAHSDDKNSHIDFCDLNQEERKKLHVAWLMSQIMQGLLSKKLVNEGWKVNTSAVEFLKQTREQCRENQFIS